MNNCSSSVTMTRHHKQSEDQVEKDAESKKQYFTIWLSMQFKTPAKFLPAWSNTGLSYCTQGGSATAVLIVPFLWGVGLGWAAGRPQRVPFPSLLLFWYMDPAQVSLWLSVLHTFQQSCGGSMVWGQGSTSSVEGGESKWMSSRGLNAAHVSQGLEVN